MIGKVAQPSFSDSLGCHGAACRLRCSFGGLVRQNLYRPDDSRGDAGSGMQPAWRTDPATWSRLPVAATHPGPIHGVAVLPVSKRMRVPVPRRPIASNSKPITRIMIGVGALIAFWLGKDAVLFNLRTGSTETNLPFLRIRNERETNG